MCALCVQLAALSTISDLNVLLRLNNEEFSLVFSDLALCNSILGAGISFKLNFDADSRSKLMFCWFSVANLTLFRACLPVCSCVMAVILGFYVSAVFTATLSSQ